MMPIFAYIGPGPGFAVQAPALALLAGVVLAGLTLLTFPLRYLLRRPKKRAKTDVRRVIVVGLDGLEPTLAERWAQELPNLQSLQYQRLATTCPPLSPVAWSSFATSVNPGKHGIFGFLHRTRDFKPFLAFSRVEKVRFGRSRPRSMRKSKSFWTVLGEHGVFSHVLRVPVTWPAEAFHGAMLSAMGVPDVRGSQGTYTLISREREELREGEWVAWEQHKDGYRAQLEVPEVGKAFLELRGATLSWQGHTQVLQVGAYSPWLPLRLGKARAIARAVLLSENPPRLYLTPLHIDPQSPAMPISYPKFYSAALAKLLGPYATCGLAEDTGGREDQILSHEQFLKQTYDIHAEREAQFFHALERTSEGLCLTVFDGTDRIQHMAMNREDTLLELYQRMDGLIGRVRSRLRKGDVLVVMSDHGFKPLRRTVDVNAWLVQEGYLTVRDGVIVWPETRAYALGLAGLHVNLKGRDANGCVEDLAGLKAELQARLESLTDGEEKPIRRVFDAQEVYQGPYLSTGPDLVIGYNPGYRISKSAARGEVGTEIFADNDSTWCGDHCLDPETVPGVLYCSEDLQDGADIRDLGPTILQWFGVTPPAYMEGKALQVAP